MKPSPGHIAKVILLGKRKKIGVVLLEAYYPDATAKLAAQKMGAKLVALAGGTANGQTYLEHIDELVGALEAALK